MPSVKNTSLPTEVPFCLWAQLSMNHIESRSCDSIHENRICNELFCWWHHGKDGRTDMGVVRGQKNLAVGAVGKIWKSLGV